MKETNVSEDLHAVSGFQDMKAGRVPYEYFDFSVKLYSVFCVSFYGFVPGEQHH